MKLSTSSQELLAKLQVVSRVASTRSAVQALSGVQIAADGSVELRATDMEVALRVPLEANIERPGTVVLPARLLVDVVRQLPTGDVSLELRPAEQDVEVVAGTAILTGILVSAGGEELRMVATDSYRLSVKETRLQAALAEGFEANVPARALEELGRLVREDVEDIRIGVRTNQVVFEVDGLALSSRLIDGQFPNYRQLLPEAYEHELTVNREELLEVVRRISLMAQKNAPLRLSFSDGEVRISAQTPDVGEASEPMPIPFAGEPFEIGFNPDFLLAGLESAGSDDVVLKLISPLRPGLLESADGSGFLYLIMPIRLNV